MPARRCWVWPLRIRWAEAGAPPLESAKGIATELYAPPQKANDTDEPRIEDGKGVLNPGVKPAFLATADAGLLTQAFLPGLWGGTRSPRGAIPRRVACVG